MDPPATLEALEELALMREQTWLGAELALFAGGWQRGADGSFTLLLRAGAPRLLLENVRKLCQDYTKQALRITEKPLEDESPTLDEKRKALIEAREETKALRALFSDVRLLSVGRMNSGPHEKQETRWKCSKKS